MIVTPEYIVIAFRDALIRGYSREANGIELDEIVFDSMLTEVIVELVKILAHAAEPFIHGSD